MKKLFRKDWKQGDRIKKEKTVVHAQCGVQPKQDEKSALSSSPVIDTQSEYCGVIIMGVF
jgi:hypothetical protein